MSDSKPIITVIGAASTTFGPKVLRDILNHPEVGGCTFRFVDINEERLDIYTKLAHRVSEVLREPIKIESTTNRREALEGSDHTIISVDTGHYTTWQSDFDIPVKHGIRQVQGGLGGPGGLFHSLRQIPLLEQPKWSNAWLIEKFVRWLDDGPPMETNVEDNLQSVALVFGAIQSSRTQAPVKVQDLLAETRREAGSVTN